MSTVLEQSEVAFPDLITALHSMEPSPRTSPVGRAALEPPFTAAEIDAIYAARQRGFSWNDVNKALVGSGRKPYKRGSTLAQTVHAVAERLGIPTYKTMAPRPGKKH